MEYWQDFARSWQDYGRVLVIFWQDLGTYHVKIWTRSSKIMARLWQDNSKIMTRSWKKLFARSCWDLDKIFQDHARLWQDLGTIKHGKTANNLGKILARILKNLAKICARKARLDNLAKIFLRSCQDKCLGKILPWSCKIMQDLTRSCQDLQPGTGCPMLAICSCSGHIHACIQGTVNNQHTLKRSK